MDVMIGDELEGKVAKTAPYGAFVTLENGKSGLIHISEIADGFVKSVEDHLREGDTVRVKVIGIDEKGKLSLSKRKASKPQSTAPAEYQQKTEASSDFEDMMSRFMSASNEKLSSLKERGDVQPKRSRKR